MVCFSIFGSEALALVRSRIVTDWSRVAFVRAAVAFTASGQPSIIVDELAPISEATAVAGVRLVVVDLPAVLMEELARCFAQQSPEWAEAQASPATTTFETTLSPVRRFASPLTMFSHPSAQPAPAIQSATVMASTTRTILIEEKNLILMPV